MIIEEAKRPTRLRDGYKLCKWQQVIMDFIDSGMDCAVLRFDEDEKRTKYVYSTALGINRAAKNLRVDMFARTVNGKTYLFRGKDE